MSKPKTGAAPGLSVAPTDIAIVGMAGRFPGARNVDEFWHNLCAGVEAISFLSDEEVLASGIDPALLDRPDYLKAEFVLDDVELFDAAFFSITPREAEIIDPQHRFFLECAWEALENAGYDPEAYKGPIGVYAGVGMNTYLLSCLYPSRGLVELVTSPEIKLANDKDHLATRVSYKLNLKGPSITVQTACSTSLVAASLACQGLLSYQCDMALVGGVTIKVPQKTGVVTLKGAASPDGHCRAFDAGAQGTANGSGVAIVVLKRLVDALAERDHVYAVLKAAAINNDGSDKVGYTAPSVKGQARAIALAQAVAGVKAETIGYVETHGTGTSLGDPIEIAALTQAFRASTQKKGFCAIGAVKTNVGHTDAAAGATGLIKTALSLKHKQIPPSLNFERPNPQIDFDNSPFYVNTRLAEWKADGGPRRAGVSSFGLGGTNAHLILQEAPAVEPPGPSRPWQLLLLSARTPTALETATTNLAQHLQQHPQLCLADVAYTLQVGRRAFGYRRALVCRDPQKAASALETRHPEHVFTAAPGAPDRPVVFMFPGAGAQHVQMGAQLYQTEPTFREQVDHCAALLQPHLGLDLRQMLYPAEARVAEATEQLGRGPVGLSALFVTAYALAQVWIAWGVSPQAMIGHSLGEYVAACLAGVFSLQDALQLVTLRGRLIDGLPKGAMLSVSLPERELRPLLSEAVALAVVNGPSHCVVSGPPEAIAATAQDLQEREVEFRRLHASRAGHSDMVTPILEPFAQAVGKMRLQAPRIPYLSNVTGTWITAAEATAPDYWARHLRQTVRFSQGVQELLKEPSRILLEVGSGRMLSSLAKKHLHDSPERVILASMRHPHDPQPDVAHLLNALGRLWLAGVTVDWAGFYAHERRQRVPLPSYPFERQRYWVEPARHPTPGAGPRPPEQVKSDVADWFQVPSWKRSVLPHAFRPAHLAGNCQRWLVFADEGELGSEIVKRLSEAGQEVVTVVAGECFEQLDACAYAVAPQQRDDYVALLEALQALDKLPTRIIYLWSVDGGDQPDALKNRPPADFYSLRHLAQTIETHAPGETLAVWVVSSGVQEVSGAEALCPERAMLLGPVLALAHLTPDVTCHNVDVVAPEPGTGQAQRLAEQILAEVSAGSPDLMVAYRGRHRWLPVLEAVRLDHKSAGQARLLEKGAYLVTGGLSDAGYPFAQYLARVARARLALVDPLGLAGDESLETGQNDAGSERPPEGEQNDLYLPLELAEEWEHINAWQADIESKAKLEAFPERLEEAVQELSVIYLYDYIRAKGLRVAAGQTYQREQLQERLGILPKFEKLYDYVLWTLAQAGAIELRGSEIEFVHDPQELGDPTALRETLSRDHPGFKDELQHLAHCVGHYDRALSGKVEAISVLYPDGTFDALAPIMKNRLRFSHTRVCLPLVGEVIQHVLEKSAGRRLRMLEVGGGSGTLTRVVTPRLKQHDVAYHFTDIGKSFVIRAEQEARREGLDFMRFGTLDISQDPVQQGYEKYSFDLILAFDVIHATKDLLGTLGHLKTLLAPNGVMLVVEAVQVPRWSPLIFGLAEGFWYFAQDPARQHLLLPAFSPEQWETLFREQGFKSVGVFPQGEEKRAQADRILIAAQQPREINTDDYRTWVAQKRAREQGAPASKARKVQALQDLGAEVLVVKADVADAEQMQTAVARACQQYGAIHGVAHAAAPGDDPGRALPALEKALHGQHLDFGLLVHTRPQDKATLLSDAATNFFLASYASASQRAKGPWISVDWDLGERDEEWAEATTAFERLLSMDGVSQVIVSPRHRQTWADRWGQPAPPAGDDGAEKTEAPTLYARPSLQSTYAAPRGETERTVAQVWQDVFGIAQIGVHDSFYELGGESLLATRIVSRLRDIFQVELPIRSLLERPTIAGVAEVLEQARDSSAAHQEPTITRAARSAYRARRTADGEIEIPDVIRGLEDQA